MGSVNYTQVKRLVKRLDKARAQWHEADIALGDGIMEFVQSVLQDKIKEGYAVVQAEHGLQGFEIVIATPPETVTEDRVLIVCSEIQKMLERAFPDRQFENYGAQAYPQMAYWHLAWVAHTRF